MLDTANNNHNKYSYFKLIMMFVSRTIKIVGFSSGILFDSSVVGFLFCRNSSAHEI